MLFDLFNISASCISYMNKALAKILDIFVLSNLNNILIYINEIDHIDSI